MEIKRLPHVKVYKDIIKEWRWQIMGGNGEIVAASSESFKNEQDCKDNLKLTMEAAQRYFNQSNLRLSLK